MRKKQQIVKRYENEKKYQRDANKQAKRGYRIVNTVSHKPHTSGCRYLMGGFLFGRKKPVMIVTYRLDGSE